MRILAKITLQLMVFNGTNKKGIAVAVCSIPLPPPLLTSQLFVVTRHGDSLGQVSPKSTQEIFEINDSRFMRSHSVVDYLDTYCLFL